MKGYFSLNVYKKTIESYLNEKTIYIELFKTHYNELMNVFKKLNYSQHIQLKRKPKINEELYIFLKKEVITI